MIPFNKKSLDLDGLEPWGAPEDVGCTTLSGAPQLFGRIDVGSFDSQVMAGVYKATFGKFQVPYPFHEHVCIVKGQVELTDETGKTYTFGPGDSWIVKKGETITWDVQSDHVLKTFFTTTVDIG